MLKKLGIELTAHEIQEILNYKPLAIENLLKRVYRVIYHNGPMKEGLNLSGSGNKGDSPHLNIYDEDPAKQSLREKDNQIQELKNIIDVL